MLSFFFFAKCLPFIYQYQIFFVCECVRTSVCSAFSLSLLFFAFLLLFSWAVVWVNLAWGSMYIIKTALGFVGCQSINQSEFNYQACDGKRWQAPGLLDSISYGAAATKNKKLESTCAWVDAGWEEGGEMEGRRGEKWERRRGGKEKLSPAAGIYYYEAGGKKCFVFLKQRLWVFVSGQKIRFLTEAFPSFAWNMPTCSECHLMTVLTFAALKCTPLFNTCKHFIRNIFF